MTVRISYLKHMLTGNLTGMAMECGFNVPDQDSADHYAAQIRGFTETNPSVDISGNKFFTSRVRTEPL